MIIDVADISQVAAARRAASELAHELSDNDQMIGRVAIVASEMATNLFKHTAGGRIVAHQYADAAGQGVELLSLDSGEGIADIDQAMTDGFSTAGTAGGGLGAIRRQADHFEIFSRPGRGTAILARIAANAAPAGDATIGAVLAPIPGEQLSGDGWVYASSVLGATLMMVDGTGHGPLAEVAARTACDVFRAHVNESTGEIIERIHRGIAHTRGGAVAIARLDERAGLVRYTGVGNIAGTLISGVGLKRMVSHNGTVGLTARRIQEFTYPYTRPALMVLHSDGLSAKWDLADYPGLAAGHPSLIAGVLFRDYWRSRDDGLVVALRAE